MKKYSCYLEISSDPTIFQQLAYLAHRDRWLHISEIFDNKKSKKLTKAFFRPLMRFYVFFPLTLYEYFHDFLYQFLKSWKIILDQFVFRSIRCQFLATFSSFSIENDGIQGISWKCSVFYYRVSNSNENVSRNWHLMLIENN